MPRNQKNLCIEGKTFSGLDPSSIRALADEFIRCTFSRCDFSNGNLSGRRFTECEFSGCNIAMANVSGTSFQSVTFLECKLSGVRFDQCNPFLFTVRFEGSILDRASLYRLKAKKTIFIKCSVKETDFTECDLSGSTFDFCALDHAVFLKTNLEKTDFRTSYNYSIDPAINRISKAKFSSSGLAGLLDKYDIVIE